MKPKEPIYSVQSYLVTFDFGNPCVLSVNVYHEGVTVLTFDEIVEEAKGYAEEAGIPLNGKEYIQIETLQKEV